MIGQAASCPHCEDLREENDYLKRQLALERDSDLASRMRKAFRLTRQQALIFATLFLTNRTVSSGALTDLISNTDSEFKLVNVQVCSLRKRVGFNSVENVFGHGYRITQSGRELIETKLGTAA